MDAVKSIWDGNTIDVVLRVMKEIDPDWKPDPEKVARARAYCEESLAMELPQGAIIGDDPRFGFYDGAMYAKIGDNEWVKVDTTTPNETAPKGLRPLSP